MNSVPAWYLSWKRDPTPFHKMLSGHFSLAFRTLPEAKAYAKCVFGFIDGTYEYNVTSADMESHAGNVSFSWDYQQDCWHVSLDDPIEGFHASEFVPWWDD